MTKAYIIGVVFLIICFLFAGCSLGNRQIGFDTKQSFDEAIIFTPTYEVVSGDVDSWRDFDNSDTIQITIDGITYLTHYSNVILIRHDNEH